MIDKSGNFWKGESFEDLREYLSLVLGDAEETLTDFTRCVCACGGATFGVRRSADHRAAERQCRACKKRHLIADAAQRWELTKPSPLKCPCGGKDFEMGVAFAIPDSFGLSRVEPGTRCVACGVLATVTANWRIADMDKDTLLKSI